MIDIFVSSSDAISLGENSLEKCLFERSFWFVFCLSFAVQIEKSEKFIIENLKFSKVRILK